MRLFGVYLFTCAALCSCGDKTDTNYTQFNSTTDTITVQIRDDIAEDTEIDLHSSTAQVIVGRAHLTPGGGPVGTEHRLVVEVFDTWQLEVVQVLLVVDSGDRGQTEFVLNRDSADPGYHQIDVVSVGDAGEIREDQFTIQLFRDDNLNTTIIDTGAGSESQQ